MRKPLDWLRGYGRIRICGAEPSRALNEATKAGIPFWDPVFQDEFTVSVSVYRKHRKQMLRLARKTGCDAEETEEFGAPKRYRGLKRRIVLLAVLSASVVAAIVLPKFVWFFSVEGNENVPSEKILRAVQSVGVRFGVYGPSIHPMQVRNRVLAMLPELEWLTVSQSGGRATVTVRERTVKEPVADRRTPSELVAVRDGVITAVSALEGSPRVAVGDTVVAGQVLISGATELERTTRLSAAIGEVYARTWRELVCAVPDTCIRKSYTGKVKKCRYLLVGKRRIKIFGDSSFSGTGCDKITVTEQLTLPEGLTLPIWVVTETCRFYEPETVCVSEEQTETFLRKTAEAVSLSQMQAGQILDCACSRAHPDGMYVMRFLLSCSEMIGRTAPLSIFTR